MSAALLPASGSLTLMQQGGSGQHDAGADRRDGDVPDLMLPPMEAWWFKGGSETTAY